MVMVVNGKGSRCFVSGLYVMATVGAFIEDLCPWGLPEVSPEDSEISLLRNRVPKAVIDTVFEHYLEAHGTW